MKKAAIGTTIVGTLTGCFLMKKEELEKESKINLTKLVGIPLSVSLFETRFGPTSISTVLDANGKKVLAYIPYGARVRSQKFVDSAALIQSEINDGDKEPIELSGRYVDNKFEIYSLKANGYGVKFPRKK